MSDIGRASVVIGAGTLVSRLTGLIRNIVLASVLGAVASPAADAFGVANQLPNNVFSIISVGVLTAVIVPQIVKATAAADGGGAFISKLFTLGTVVLTATTVLAMIGAPWLVMISANGTPEQLALATAFAYWCLPQILFYGLYAMVGETLNARRIFGPFTWAPIANNIISIIGFLVIAALFGSNLTEIAQWTPPMIAALAGTTTAATIVQAAILLLFWRRTGLRLRPDFRWRGVGLGQIGRMAGWTFLMASASLAAGVFQGWVAYTASGVGPSVAAMGYMWLIYMLPYSIIVISIGTPYFTQLAEHAAAGRDSEVTRDIDTSIRTLGFFVFGAVAAVAAAAIPAARVFTGSAEHATQAALVLLAYLLALAPMAALFIIQRTFYAYGDTRTPFFFTLLHASLIVVSAAVAGVLADAGVLPLALLGAVIALSQSLCAILQTIVATVLLHRRLGSIHTASWLGAYGRFLLAAVPAGLAGYGLFLLMGGIDGWTTAEKVPAVAGTAVIGIAALIVYLAVLALVRAPELNVARGIVTRILRR